MITAIKLPPTKKRKCVKGRECGNSCIDKNERCKKNDSKIKILIDRLLNGRKSQAVAKLRRQRRGPISHVTVEDALLASKIYAAPDFAALKTNHPYIKFNKPTDHEVDTLAENLKSKNPSVYEALAEKGLRVLKGEKNTLSKDEKVKIFIRLYLEQNGQSFATGKVKGFNNLTIDHIIPISKGGTNDVKNLVLIENNINFSKGAKSLEDFTKTLNLRLGIPRDQYIEALKDPVKAAVLKKTARDSDRALAQAWKSIGSARDKEMNKWKNGAWAGLDVPTLKDMSYRQIKDALKILTKELSVPYSWYTSPTETGGRTTVPPLDAARAMVLAYRGVPVKDVPSPWVELLKERVKKNGRPQSSQKFLDVLNDEWKKALEG